MDWHDDDDPEGGPHLIVVEVTEPTYGTQGGNGVHDLADLASCPLNRLSCDLPADNLLEMMTSPPFS